MWGIRFLSGAQAGQVLPLKMGKNVLGRAASCDIKILSPGVSKEHSEVFVSSDKVLITDLRSSNGTYVNGVKIQTGQIRSGDKVSVHDIIFDLVPVAAEKAQQTPRSVSVSNQFQNSVPQNQIQMGHAPSIRSGFPPSSQAMNGYDHQGSMGGGSAGPVSSFTPPQNIFEKLQNQFNDYMERVVLPALYRIAEWMDLKYILIAFVIAFIFSTTLLSMIPMVTISKESIMSESMRRAKSLARSVATLNQGALLQGNITALSTYTVEAEEGVKQVLVIDQRDGSILAPASRAGVTADLPFVHKARQESRAMVAEVDSSTIGASFPIGAFDPNTGEQIVKAHAVVLYDISSLDFDSGRAISLFLQTLVISSILGLILFYFMYALFEYPLKALNAELDIALREKKDSTAVKFVFPPLQALIGNINSLLNRYLSGDSQNGSVINRDGEAENLVAMMGYPAMCLNSDMRIMAANSGFNQIAHSDGLTGMNVSQIPDSALQQNIQFLVQRTQEQVRSIHTDTLEFSGHLCTLSCHARIGAQGQAEYYVFTIAPAENGGS